MHRLVAQGACIRVDGGVIMPKATVQRPHIVHAVNANVGYVRRFVHDLQAVGLGIVAQTIVVANTAHLDARNGEGWRYVGIEDAPPDEARQAISVARLAESLGLPFETVRRYVQRLIDAGDCVRIEGGVIVPRSVQERPAAVRGAVTNVGYVRKFVHDLHGAVTGLAE